MQEREASSRRASIVDRMIGAARLRVSTFEDVEADRSATRQAMLVVIAVAIATGIGSVGGGVTRSAERGGLCPRGMGGMGLDHVLGRHSVSTDDPDPRRLGSAGPGTRLRTVASHLRSRLDLAARGDGDCSPASVGLRIHLAGHWCGACGGNTVHRSLIDPRGGPRRDA